MTPIMTTLPTAMALTPSRAAGCDSDEPEGWRPCRDGERSIPASSGDPARLRATTAGSGRRNTRRSRTASAEQERREEVGAGQGGHAVPAHRCACQRRQARPHDGADRGRPDDHGEMPAPKRRRRQVHRGIAGLQIRGGCAAEQKKAEEQERNRAPRRRGEDDDRPHRCHEIARGQARPPAVAVRTMAVAGIANSAVPTTAALCARPDRPTPAMSAASSAPTDAPTATPDAADDLGDEEQAQRTALDGGDFHGPTVARPGGQSTGRCTSTALPPY